MSEKPRAPDAPTLVLVPTELELARLEDQGALDPELARIRLCGFGPIAAAARTAQLLAAERPPRVLLVGIAGAYDIDRHPVGSALEFAEVAVEGIGVGEGERLLPPPALGFPQWPGSQGGATDPIFDRLDLDAAGGKGELLLTTCGASDSREHAEARRSRFPEAAAEDMEGFAVATACALTRTPLRIVRGVSNRAGDRDAASWRIPAALAAARRLAAEIIESHETWGGSG